jgi:hypothetical protein
MGAARPETLNEHKMKRKRANYYSTTGLRQKINP